MPIFSTPEANDSRFFEATVTAVDAVRKCCKIITVFKQSMDSVQWLSGDSISPKFGDKVFVTTVTGYPIILGILPTVGDDTTFAIDIDTGGLEADTGNYSTLSRGFVADPNKPGDFIAEDKVFSNSEGGLFGLLKGGTFIAKASKLAQILISKYDDLVRIIGRNYELFTDVCIEVIANVRGRGYMFRGYSDTIDNVRNDVYKYTESYGDIVLAETLQGDYYGYTPATFALLPAPVSSIIRKYQINDGAGGALFEQYLYSSTGQLYTIVRNPATSVYTYANQYKEGYVIKTLNGTFVKIETTPTSITMTYNDQNTITINSAMIELNYATGGAVVRLDGTQTLLNYGSHQIVIDGAGVHVS